MMITEFNRLSPGDRFQWGPRPYEVTAVNSSVKSAGRLNADGKVGSPCAFFIQDAEHMTNLEKLEERLARENAEHTAEERRA